MVELAVLEQKFIAWNIENWITVLLMTAAGYMVFSLVMSYAFPRPMAQAA